MLTKKRFWLALILCGGSLFWFFRETPPSHEVEVTPESESSKSPEGNLAKTKGLFDLIMPGLSGADSQNQEAAPALEAAKVFQAVLGDNIDGTGFSDLAPGAGANVEPNAKSSENTESQESDLQQRERLQNKVTHMSFESPALINDAFKTASEVRESTIVDADINKLLISAASRCAQEQGSTPEGQRFIVEVFNTLLDQRKRDPQAQANSAEVIRVVQDEALAKQMRDTWAERFSEARAPATEQ